MAYRAYRTGRGSGYGSGGGGGPQINLMARITPMVKYLLIANGVVAVAFVSRAAAVLIMSYLSLIPAAVFPGLQLWRVVTYMFVHANLSHLLLNMIALYFFGPPLEQVWGKNKFLFYFFLTGIGAGIACVPFYILLGEGGVPIVGASGALYGLLAAFALIYPNARIYLMFLFPIKAKYLVAVFVIIEFMSTASAAAGAGGSHIANVAHLSGAVIGYFYLRRFMDLKAYWLRLKLRRHKRAYRVISNPRDDPDQRGPWLH
ncbi:MAG TPA: rhomboid family intramembrane serine protease [bacterium]|nr:rhomboid family intramembrane serine protease [bacterium]